MEEDLLAQKETEIPWQRSLPEKTHNHTVSFDTPQLSETEPQKPRSGSTER